MPQVSVDSQTISKAKAQCVSAEKEMDQCVSTLKKGLSLTANGWNDQKSKEFCDIVNQSIVALKKPADELKRCEAYLQKLADALTEYESVSFGGRNTQGDNSASLESNGLGGVFGRMFGRSGNINRALNGVEYRPLQAAPAGRTEQQIISSLSGGDMTEGSCSSLALAYAGNRAGYVVNDFRGGRSREVFSSRNSIDQIANMQGVNSIVVRGNDDGISAERLMGNMERGNEYYMATGRHAAVVRMDEQGRYQYLELQSEIHSDNGWQPLTQRALYERFGCEDGHRTEWSNYLIDLNSLQGNSDFISLLGYINTDSSEQICGGQGHVR